MLLCVHVIFVNVHTKMKSLFFLQAYSYTVHHYFSGLVELCRELHELRHVLFPQNIQYIFVGSGSVAQAANRFRCSYRSKIQISETLCVVHQLMLYDNDDILTRIDPYDNHHLRCNKRLQGLKYTCYQPTRW